MVGIVLCNALNAQITWWIPQTIDGKTFVKKHIAHKESEIDAEMALLNYNPVLKLNTSTPIDLSQYDMSECEIFTVFVPSKSNQEELIWKLGSQDNDALLFTSKRIADLSQNQFMNFIGRDLTQPQIVNYHHDKNAFSGTHLTLHNLPKNEAIPVVNFQGHLAELIIFDRRVSPITRQIIESHLALKYNVPLADGLDYLNSRGEAIFVSNDDFRNRVSAMGRCDALHFYQKQSQTKLGKGFVGFSVGDFQTDNLKNENTIIDDTYLIWADDGQPLVFQKQHDEVGKLKRTWLLKSQAFKSSDKLSFTFSHDKIIDDLKSDEYLWLAINQNVGDEEDIVPTFYKLNKNSKQETEVQIELLESENIANIFKAPSLWAYMSSEDISCDQKSGKLMIVPVGAKAPYEVHVRGVDNKFDFSHILNKPSDHVSLDVELGNYTIEIQDNEGDTWKSEMTINSNLLAELDLPSSVLLDGNDNLTIDASLNQENVIYNWTTPQNQNIGSSEISIDRAGTYKLEVTKDNCKSWHTIDVEAVQNNIESLSVFPNPTASGHFQLSASLQLPAEYQIKITDELGRLVSHKSYDQAQYILHKEKIEHPGIYIISLITTNEIKTKKLIVID